MHTIEFTLPAADARELMPFEVTEVWPDMPCHEGRDSEPLGCDSDPQWPAEACTELGCDDEPPPMSSTEQRLSWLVRAGIAVAMGSLVMVMLPG
jgi:hypothetical protein